MVFRGVIDEFNRTCVDIANELGVSVAEVSSTFRYSNNKEEVKEMIRVNNTKKTQEKR